VPAVISYKIDEDSIPSKEDGSKLYANTKTTIWYTLLLIYEDDFEDQTYKWCLDINDVIKKYMNEPARFIELKPLHGEKKLNYNNKQ